MAEACLGLPMTVVCTRTPLSVLLPMQLEARRHRSQVQQFQTTVGHLNLNGLHSRVVGVLLRFISIVELGGSQGSSAGQCGRKGVEGERNEKK